MFRDVPGCSGMFRDVPECSGMFRHVPECSMFRVLSTAFPFCHESLWSFLDRDEIYLFHVSHVIGYWFVRFDTRERNVSLLRLRRIIFQFCAQCPGHWIEASLAVTLFCYKPCCFSYVNDHVFTGLLAWEHDLYMKSRKVCNKTRSPAASLLFKGQGTEQTTVKWPTFHKT